jgi:hypothetical protein
MFTTKGHVEPGRQFLSHLPDATLMKQLLTLGT